jgi:Sec7-like guanine-nucleotide exchange factor
MSSFEFSHDPIDLSLRKLLMVVDLPSETQQIDRVIESFSKRYTHCNPKLFSSPGPFPFFLHFF